MHVVHIQACERTNYWHVRIGTSRWNLLSIYCHVPWTNTFHILASKSIVVNSYENRLVIIGGDQVRYRRVSYYMRQQTIKGNETQDTSMTSLIVNCSYRVGRYTAATTATIIARLAFIMQHPGRKDELPWFIGLGVMNASRYAAAKARAFQQCCQILGKNIILIIYLLLK